MRANLKSQIILKTFFYTVVVFFICSLAFGSIPYLINYQGKLTDSSGNPVGDGHYLMTFGIWTHETSTCSCERVWNSPDQLVLVTDGLFNYQLGSNIELSPSVFIPDTALWLSVKVGEEEIRPRTMLISVPYACKSYKADFAGFADSTKRADTAAFSLTGISNVRTGVESGTGSVSVTFSPAFPPGTTPKIHAVAVLRTNDGGSGMLKGMAVYPAVADVSEAGFTATFREESGGLNMPAAEVDLYYFAIL